MVQSKAHLLQEAFLNYFNLPATLSCEFSALGIPYRHLALHNLLLYGSAIFNASNVLFMFTLKQKTKNTKNHMPVLFPQNRVCTLVYTSGLVGVQ